MAGLFAAQVKPVLAHMLYHIAVAHTRARQPQPLSLQISLKPQIGHNGCDNARRAQALMPVPVGRNQPHNLVAINNAAVLVANDEAVGIAIKRNADIGFFRPYRVGQKASIGRTAALVYVEPVRCHADGDNFGPQFPKRGRGDLIGGTISTIDHQLDAIKREMARKGALGKFDIARLAVVNAFGATQLGRRRQFAVHRCVHQGFNLIFDFVGKFETVWPEQLDAVVLKGIMRGRNHNADIGTQ